MTRLAMFVVGSHKVGTELRVPAGIEGWTKGETYPTLCLFCSCCFHEWLAEVRP